MFSFINKLANTFRCTLLPSDMTHTKDTCSSVIYICMHTKINFHYQMEAL